jgi:hypothetical protein
MKRIALVFGMLWLAAGITGPLSAEPSSLLADPAAANVNAASSPKLDDRVFVYSAKPISAAVLEHVAGSREMRLDVGARDGVRFGHAFQIMAQGSELPIGVAEVIELERQRCVARVISLNQDQAAQSMRGFSAVCTAPRTDRRAVVIQCVFGKDVWQTESLENKLIRGLLENSGRNEVQILIRQDDAAHASG